MTNEEFLKCVAYITAGSGKNLSPDSLVVYFDLLGDLPFEVLLTAAKRVALEHPWPSFPSIAELRQAASETARGAVKELSAAEAWAMARKLEATFDPEVQGPYFVNRREYASQWDFLIEGLPPLVLRAIVTFGVSALADRTTPESVIRGQFVKVYEQLAAGERRAALYPPKVRQAIEGIGKQLPERVQTAIAAIGQGTE